MIQINISPADFEYDVQSLIQAFYPGEPFQVNKEYDKNSSDYRAVLDVNLNDDNIEIRFLYGKVFSRKAKCNYKDRRETKNILKSLLYTILVEATGKTLPWGNLTGIRPAKIPALMMQEGKSKDEIKKIMKETYLISDEKLELSMDIAEREFSILSSIPYEEGYSLYVGIPFCPTTCLYCSFTSYPIKLYKDKTEEYLDALIKEIEQVSKMLEGRILNSVYIGGGTPTTLEASQLDRLIKELKNNFDFSNVVEFTVEAGRPDSITRDKLETLMKNGVDRISINPQTMNQDTLDLIGRKHSVNQVVDTFNLAREVGFTNINMDLIIGLPGEDEEKVAYTLEEIEKLSPDSLTVHSLAVKRAARLNIQKEKYNDFKMESNTRLMALSEKYARAMGMKPYYLYRQKNTAGNQENVGYAREGYEGIYNILMMGDKQNIIALGAGATTKMMSEDRISATRIDGLKNVDLYIERIDEMIDRKREYLENHQFYDLI